jgi:hypothetical protein
MSAPWAEMTSSLVSEIPERASEAKRVGETLGLDEFRIGS